MTMPTKVTYHTRDVMVDSDAITNGKGCHALADCDDITSGFMA
jgi:hypothetical protein